MQHKKVVAVNVKNLPIKPMAPGKSYLVHPIIKKGNLVWIYGHTDGMVENMGIVLASAIATGHNVFKDSYQPWVTTDKSRTMYIHKYFLSDEHIAHMGSFITNYTKANDANKAFDGNIPFGLIQASLFEFHINFWKSKHCKAVKEAIQDYDVIIIDDYERIFGNKNMNITEVMTVINKWRDAGKTVIVLDQAITHGEDTTRRTHVMDKHKSKIKASDVVLEIDVDTDEAAPYRVITRKNDNLKVFETTRFTVEIYNVDGTSMMFQS